MDRRSLFATYKKKQRAPSTQTYKDVGEYLASKQCLRSLKFRSYEWDRPRHDPYFDLVEASRSFENAKNQLEDKRQYARTAQQHLKQQWQELYHEEETFKETVVSMTDFLVSNYNKRERARLRLEEDRKICAERNKKIEDIKAMIAEEERVKTAMEEDIEKLLIYKKFLKQVVSKKPGIKFPEELIDRYDALVSTRQYLADRQAAALQKLEEARFNTAKSMEEGALVFVGLYNEIADLRGRYFTAFRKAALWEGVVDDIKNYQHQRYQEVCLVKQACWNLYKMMCLRKGQTFDLKDEGNVEKQLIYIKKTLERLTNAEKMTKNTD